MSTLGEVSITSLQSVVSLSSVRTKRGYLGQIIYKGEIVWESGARTSQVDAMAVAEQELKMRLTHQFAQAAS